LLRKGDIRRARNVVYRLEANGDPSHAGIVAARAHLDISEKLGRQAISRLNTNPTPFMHSNAILLECYVRCAEQEGAIRHEIAKMGLAQSIPEEFRTNMHILVERAKLAALAEEKQLFENEIARLLSMKYGSLRKSQLLDYWNKWNSQEAGPRAEVAR
jgi:hypothetical protein